MCAQAICVVQCYRASRHCSADIAVLTEVLFRLRHIQGDSRLVDITAGGDFLGLCDQKS